MPDSSGEKTEDPTPRRIQEARDEGNVPRSQDLSAAIALMAAMLLLMVMGNDIFAAFRALLRSMLGGQWGRPATGPEDIGQILAVAGMAAARIALPIALALFAVGIAANVVQVGFMVTLKPLTPNLNKLSPLKGLKNLFSRRAAMRMVMSLLKVFIVVAIATVVIMIDMPKALALIRLEPAPLLAAASGVVIGLALKIGALLLVLALLDFIYQRWQHQQDLRMTKQEVKEEWKRMEGDPLVKQRRSKVARQLALQRISADVPGSDVVVTNPTHFAVALKYDDSMAAPKVVAKGADYLAMRIRQIAAANEIPVVERPPLARSLYRHVEVGQEIPAKFYAAVAEILAYVYRLRRTGRAAG
jgi:flagellar biosynthetic protein FlhB